MENIDMYKKLFFLFLIINVFLLSFAGYYFLNVR